MSNNLHIFAITEAALLAEMGDDPDADAPFGSSAMQWCGDTFETGYVFHEQLDSFVLPFADDQLRQILAAGGVPLSTPAIERLRRWGNVGAAELTILDEAALAMLKAAAARSIADADWGADDSYEWQALVASTETGDFYAIVEFV